GNRQVPQPAPAGVSPAPGRSRAARVSVAVAISGREGTVSFPSPPLTGSCSAERADPRHDCLRVGAAGDDGEDEVRRADRVTTGPKVVTRPQTPGSGRPVRTCGPH